VGDITIKNAIVSDDNSKIYNVAQTSIGSTDVSVVMRMNHHFVLDWSKTFEGSVSHDSIEVSTDGSEVLVVPYLLIS